MVEPSAAVWVKTPCSVPSSLKVCDPTSVYFPMCVPWPTAIQSWRLPTVERIWPLECSLYGTVWACAEPATSQPATSAAKAEQKRNLLENMDCSFGLRSKKSAAVGAQTERPGVAVAGEDSC